MNREGRKRERKREIERERESIDRDSKEKVSEQSLERR